MPDLTAKDILRRFAKIVSADRLVHSIYVDDGGDTTRSNALCGGHRACAIGSLWIAAGIKPERDDEFTYILPTAHPGNRYAAFAQVPGLEEAYYALNAAAADYMASEDLDPTDTACGCYEGELEVLFESHGADANTLVRIAHAATKELA